MAASTCEACTLPDEQAEPDDTATPSRSKAIIAVSAFMPGTANSVVLGSRAALRAENHRLRRRGLDARFEPVAQRRHAARVRLPCAPRGSGGGAEAGDCRDILGAGAQRRAPGRRP